MEREPVGPPLSPQLLRRYGNAEAIEAVIHQVPEDDQTENLADNLVAIKVDNCKYGCRPTLAASEFLELGNLNMPCKHCVVGQVSDGVEPRGFLLSYNPHRTENQYSLICVFDDCDNWGGYPK